MSEARAIGSVMPTNRMLKFTAFLFDAVAYFTFLFTILYAIGFVSDLVVPKAIDTGANSPVLKRSPSISRCCRCLPFNTA